MVCQSYNIQSTFYELSMATKETNIDEHTKRVVFFLHLLELFFLMLALSLVGFVHYVIRKSRCINMLNVNLLFSGYFCISIFYIQLFFRVTIFVAKMSCIVKDASQFDSLKLLHFARESCIIISALSVPALSIDRWIATYYSEAYEQASIPYIGIATLLVAIVITFVVEIFHYFDIIYVTTIAMLVAGCCMLAVMVLIHLHKFNKKYMLFFYEMSLSKKFQIKENIKICSTIIPSALAMCFGVLLIALTYILVFVLKNQPNISILLATIYNDAIALCFLVAPITYIVPSRELRFLVINSFECNTRTAMVSPKPFPNRTPEEEREIYFDQLRQMWK